MVDVILEPLKEGLNHPCDRFPVMKDKIGESALLKRLKTENTYYHTYYNDDGNYGILATSLQRWRVFDFFYAFLYPGTN